MELHDDEDAEEIASHLDYCVDHLAPGVLHQPSPDAYEMYVDLMMGLAMTAQSLRARSRGDICLAEQHQATASACLSRVHLNQLILTDDLDFPHDRE